MNYLEGATAQPSKYLVHLYQVFLMFWKADA